MKRRATTARIIHMSPKSRKGIAASVPRRITAPKPTALNAHPAKTGIAARWSGLFHHLAGQYFVAGNPMRRLGAGAIKLRTGCQTACRISGKGS